MSDEKQSILEHIEELRKTLFNILIGLILSVIVAAFFVKPILIFLSGPMGGLEKLHAIEVTESVGVYMRIALLAGFLLALPWTFSQLFIFIGKGLKDNERKNILIAVPFATLMFVGGVIFAFYIMLPASLDFLMSILGIQTMIRVKSYFSFVTNLLFWIGISFELPLIVYILARFGLIKAKVMLKGWRVAIVIIAILAAIITPTSDPVNMAIFMIPLFVLYLLSIGLAAIAEKQRAKPDAAESLEV
ncbi:MAG TPA: twin-arginine translocase subunit TatC, partial [Anaerolineaceae bacterium]|jgi:sec-independent protein translocase protein TatC|nr:twin-arginine translocase subunit TatC [Chloroflexota bacterium]HPL82321.1 twin-arginine translocase subunit TatC [Anaerolineaceae bacterium]